MSDFYEEWASWSLWLANHGEDASQAGHHEEMASELLSLARVAREAQ